MGKLVDGVWRDERYDTKKSGGGFRRSDSAFRDRVTADGSSGFAAGPGRYHLYVSLACPWAQRTLISRWPRSTSVRRTGGAEGAAEAPWPEGQTVQFPWLALRPSSMT